MAKKDEQAASEADEAAAVEAQNEEEARAAQKRATQADKASELKSYPDDAGAPPTQKKASGGETAYSVERLVTESESFLGLPTHVVAGALFGVDKEYLTVAEAQDRVDAWLKQTPVSATAETEE